MAKRRRRWHGHSVRLGKWLAAAVAAAVIAVPVTDLLTSDSDSDSSAPQTHARSAQRASPVRIRSSIEYQAGDHWIVPAGQLDGSTPPDAADCTRGQVRRKVSWFRAHGALPYGGYFVRIEVVNDSRETLTIESLQLETFERLPLVEGVPVVLCSEGGGDIGLQYVALDLSARPPRFRFLDDTYRPTHSFTFAPERNEPAVVYVVVRAGGSAFGPPDRHRYRWTMRLRYSLGGRVYGRVIDDEGRPFDLVAYQPSPPPAG